jgi:LmbE family N-acetylglucosaminyl deacetylase
MFQELELEGIEPFEVQNLWLGSNEPDTYVDITATIDIKLKSLEQHVSQGTADAEPWVRLRAEEAGKEAGCTYAEGFKAFRFIDDPVEE